MGASPEFIIKDLIAERNKLANELTFARAAHETMISEIKAALDISDLILDKPDTALQIPSRMQELREEAVMERNLAAEAPIKTN